ncbi:MAG: nucleotidyltransferase domain-containing protein [Treponema sp.]|nr:nucleotidyltransferase domain-containing protein [Treponema sp.]MDD7534597.1 nucleotidyltransferase domain-containing protein [Treponema sp.]MDY3722683.1 nucleotidyltransferase domain-containing protein [Treponema sp.]MDY5758467.1 nucleotidyltransferase domain-containing protein [Treponema sp.]MDY5817682.1 nucleotidyltransferase domain-containing protein [Treponema sp.]
MNESEDIQLKLTEYFSQKADIDTVLLFGSFAKGTYNEHSDIDIAIHSSDSLEYETLAKIQTELSLLCKREIDLTDLSKAEGIFLYQIMTRGVKIKIKATVFVKYLTEALCFKEDFLPVIEYSHREKIRRFVNG